MPGPKPTPTNVLALRGSWRAKTRADEPDYTVLTEAEPPEDLTERAQEIWKEIAPRLIGAGVLSVGDLPAFTRYVRLYAAWEKQMEEVESGGAERQAVLSLAKLDDMVRRLEANFGLTPSDRTGIKVDKPAPKGKDRFFGAA